MAQIPANLHNSVPLEFQKDNLELGVKSPNWGASPKQSLLHKGQFIFCRNLIAQTFVYLLLVSLK
jgi:hypothetical protein